MIRDNVSLILAALILAAPVGASAQTQATEETETVTRSLSRIDWRAVQRDAAEAGVDNVAPGGGLASFEGTGRSTADNLQIPVLLPSSLLAARDAGALDEPFELLARTNDYSAEAKQSPRRYYITGTRVFFESPPGGDALASTSEELLVETSLYGISASFERYGVAYTVEIECDLPTADPECIGEQKVRRLVAEMTFV
ncbi:MAG: hypothetical protein AAGM38_18495, partial [Pseudomonadota bacterium]